VPAQITALPTPPSTNDPANFNTRADAFLGQMPTFVTEANALATEVNTNATQAAADRVQTGSDRDAAAASASSALNAPSTNGTSTTSLTIGTGTKSLTTQTGKAWSVGQSLSIANTAAPTNRMIGVLTAYNSGTGAVTVQVTTAEGSGTFTAWTIAMAAGAPMAVASQADAEVGTDNSKVLTPLRGAQQIAKLAIQRADAPVTSTTTLTSSSAYSQIFKGAGHGFAFILPDATALPTGPRFSFTNDSGFDVTIRDSTGVARRFVRPKETCVALLQENASASGIWRWMGGSPLGTSARHPVPFLASSNPAGEGVFQVRLDTTRDLILYSYSYVNTTYYAAVVYDRATNTFGTTLSMNSTSTGNFAGFIRARLVGADKVLMVFMSSNTQATARVLTTSGLDVTAGPVYTATVAASFTVSDSALFDIETLGSTHVLSLVDGAGSLRVCGMTISGTTVTFGASTVAVAGGGSLGSPANDYYGIVRTVAGGVPTLLVMLGYDVTMWVRTVTFSGTTPTVSGTFASNIAPSSTRRAVVLPSGSIAMFLYGNDLQIWCFVYYWTGSYWAVTTTNLTTTYGWLANSEMTIGRSVAAKVSGSYLLANYINAVAGSASALQFTEGVNGALALVGSAQTFSFAGVSLNTQRAAHIATQRDGSEIFSLGGGNSNHVYLKVIPGNPSGAKLFSTVFDNNSGVYLPVNSSDVGFIARSTELMSLSGRCISPGYMCAIGARKVWTFVDGEPVAEEGRLDMRGPPVNSVYNYHSILKDGADKADVWGIIATFESGYNQFNLTRFEIAV
jgi:hypothetical protein